MVAQAHPINLPTTLGGFSFNGIHSSTFGVRETPGNRTLSPLKRRKLFNIPGTSRHVIQEDGAYEARVQSIQCSYARQRYQNVQDQCRLIAGWLQGVGDLVYDYEPDIHYRAFLSNAPPLVKDLEYATFELEFTCDPPFGLGEEINVTAPFLLDPNPVYVVARMTIISESPFPIPFKIKATSFINHANAFVLSNRPYENDPREYFSAYFYDGIPHMSDLIIDSDASEAYFIDNSNGSKMNLAAYIHRTEKNYLYLKPGQNMVVLLVRYPTPVANPIYPTNAYLSYTPRFF